MRFFQVDESSIIWTTLQTVLLVALFVSGVWHWAREKRFRSMACALVGAFTGSLLIQLTRPLAGGGKPFEATALVMMSMTLLQVLLVVYLGSEADWSNWRVDVGLGSIVGISMGVARTLAAQGALWLDAVVQSIALAVPAVLGLLGIRKLKERTLPSALAAAVLLVATVTAILFSLGYAPRME